MPHWCSTCRRHFVGNDHVSADNSRRRPFRVVEAPVLALWSGGDAYLTEAPVTNSAQWVRGPWSYRRVEGASHWMQLDRPALINRLILDFLGADVKPS